MKPRRSRSIAMAVVKGDVGEPARTTASVLAPLFDFLALLFFTCVDLCMKTRTAPVPTKANIPALRAVLRDIHRLTLFQYVAGVNVRGGGGGGRGGWKPSGSQSLSCVATLSKCLSTPPANSLYCCRAESMNHCASVIFRRSTVVLRVFDENGRLSHDQVQKPPSWLTAMRGSQMMQLCRACTYSRLMPWPFFQSDIIQNVLATILFPSRIPALVERCSDRKNMPACNVSL